VEVPAFTDMYICRGCGQGAPAADVIEPYGLAQTDDALLASVACRGTLC